MSPEVRHPQPSEATIRLSQLRGALFGRASEPGSAISPIQAQAVVDRLGVAFVQLLTDFERDNTESIYKEGAEGFLRHAGMVVSWVDKPSGEIVSAMGDVLLNTQIDDVEGGLDDVFTLPGLIDGPFTVSERETSSSRIFPKYDILASLTRVGWSVREFFKMELIQGTFSPVEKSTEVI